MGATPPITSARRQRKRVRLVRHIASTGKVRVLMTILLDPVAFPAHEFGDLYHQRWRIEEAFKRLKHRFNLEHFSGLSQQAALHDFSGEDRLRQPTVPGDRNRTAQGGVAANAAHQPRSGPLHPETAIACSAARR